MKSLVCKVFMVSIALGVAAFALVGAAGASHVTAEVSVPDQVAIGQPVEVRASFHSDSNAASVAGMTVIFHEEVALGGVTGDVELGRAVTDENGVAVLAYEARAAGEHQIHVRYTFGDGDAEDAAASFTVPAGTQQLYRSTAGIKIPGLNVWLLMALVAIVWAILLSVAARVIAIAHAGADALEATDASEASGVGRADLRAGSVGGR